MQSGAALLREWVEKRDYNQKQAAEILGLADTFLSMLLHGHRVPSLDNAIRIERLTGIPVEAWVSSVDDKTAQPVGASGAKSKNHKR